MKVKVSSLMSPPNIQNNKVYNSPKNIPNNHQQILTQNITWRSSYPVFQYNSISQTCIRLQSIVSLITRGQYLVQRSNLERPVKKKVSHLILLNGLKWSTISFSGAVWCTTVFCWPKDAWEWNKEFSYSCQNLQKWLYVKILKLNFHYFTEYYFGLGTENLFILF